MKGLPVAAIVRATVVSDLLQSHKMKRAGEQCCFVFRVQGIGAEGTAELRSSRIASQLLLETLLAKFVLHERSSLRRAAGAVIVLAGAVLVGG
jgi:hypothetical protein